MNNNQATTYSGVAAHHQNGVAERKIQELQKMERSMIIHANRRWSNAVTTQLWPYAIAYAAKCINSTPNTFHNHLFSPEQIFTHTTLSNNKINHFYPFACPTYSIMDDLSGDIRIFDKWKARSKLGIFLGHSKKVT